ncbi:MAG: choice-of-anchor Q domain-containing protein, partial [Actinomycetota bacterium]
MHRHRFVLLFTLSMVGVLLPTASASAAVITPTVFTDEPSSGDCSLRDAIRSADFDLQFDQCTTGAGADTIVLQAGTYSLTLEGDGEDNAETGDLDIFSSDLTIIGAGPGATFIDGAWPSDPDRIFETRDGGDLTLSGLTLRDGETPDQGGAVQSAADTTLTIRQAILESNEAQDGGAIANEGLLQLTDVSVVSNVAIGCCGGVLDENGSTLMNVTIAGNQATFNGGGSATNGSLTNVTVSGNSATDTGGGYMADGDVTINSSTITANTADSDNNGSGDGGGLANDGGADTATLSNSIVAGNVDRGGEAPDCDDVGSTISAGHNLIGNTTGCAFTPGTADLQNVDPMLGPLADNGGLTMTHALLPGSPAIDAGGSDAAPTDQRGLPRNPDIGAYELVLCKKVPINRIGTAGNDLLTGTSGADGFLAQDGNDRAKGLGGNDAACMGGGKDTA